MMACKELTVVTFNIRQPWDYPEDGVNSFIHRAGMILDKIDRFRPDVICFQEVKPEEKYFFEKYLVDYDVYAQGRNADLGGEGLAMAFLKGKIQMLSADRFWLSPSPYVPGSRFDIQSDCPRICLSATVKKEGDERVFRIYNVHLDHESEAARLAQAECLLDRIAEDGEKLDLPFLLMGDLNAYPDSETIRYLDTSGKISLKELTKDIKYTFHGFGTRDPLVKFDYIYADEKTAKLPYDVAMWKDCRNGIYLSDHYPVCLTLKFDK